MMEDVHEKDFGDASGRDGENPMRAHGLPAGVKLAVKERAI